MWVVCENINQVNNLCNLNENNLKKTFRMGSEITLLITNQYTWQFSWNRQTKLFVFELYYTQMTKINGNDISKNESDDDDSDTQDETNESDDD